jgi:hypothetical protein
MANPNPSPETRFKPGHALGGKTAEQRRFEYEAAEIAAMRLFKDSEDRAHGTPRQSVEHSGQGENGEIIFKTVYHTKDG